MRADEIRLWVGWYMLGLVCFLATYILLFGGTWLLPLERGDRTSAFEIIVPFLLSQITTIFAYYGKSAPPRDTKLSLPVFVVKGPLILIGVVLLATVVAMAIGGLTGSPATPSGETFKAVVVFAVALMNASSVVVISKVFSANAGEG